MKRGALSKGLLAARLRGLMATRSLRSRQTPSDKIVFVIGTGRSGTHFLTRCLIGNDQLTDLTGGKENPLVFKDITAAALDFSRQRPLLDNAARIYGALASVAKPAWLVDQSHPNIWFAEHWSKVFPNAYFVAIIRNPYSVVASMTKHRDVKAWALQWDRYPIPNRFLGITNENARLYSDMSLVQRCTLRWICHYQRVQQLRSELGQKLSVVIYEELCAAPKAILAPIAERLKVDHEFALPNIDCAALTRGANMSRDDVADIRQLLVQSNVEQRWLEAPW